MKQPIWALISLAPLFGAVQSYRYLEQTPYSVGAIWMLILCAFLFVTCFIHSFKK